jgi:hypothetical protein
VDQWISGGFLRFWSRLTRFCKVDWDLWSPEIFWELFFPRVKQLTVCPDTGFADFADLQNLQTRLVSDKMVPKHSR